MLVWPSTLACLARCLCPGPASLIAAPVGHPAATPPSGCARASLYARPLPILTLSHPIFPSCLFRPSADPGSDSSEDERPNRNTIGEVPLQWYKDEEHVGYDVEGRWLQ